jgi:hypothetical protein
MLLTASLDFGIFDMVFTFYDYDAVSFSAMSPSSSE